MPETRPLQVHHLKAACSSCSVLELCLPIGLSGAEVERLDTLIVQRFKVKKGAALYRTGDPLRSLYAVRIGSFKTSVLSVDGREQVTGFHIPGEMLGLDAISADEHARVPQQHIRERAPFGPCVRGARGVAGRVDEQQTRLRRDGAYTPAHLSDFDKEGREA